MKILTAILIVMAGVGLVGCSGGSGDEPQASGSRPPVKQAEPGMVPPEERARMNTGGGEGSE